MFNFGGIFKWLGWLWLLSLLGVLGGCVAPGGTAGDTAAADHNLKSALTALESARFKGEVFLDTGGSPLGFHQRASFWVGPGETNFRVNGQVDFQNTPRDQTPAP